MRVRCTIGFLAVWPLVAFAQVVPQGATPDAVVQALGTPRSRSTAKGREIWIYPTYQVVFEQGRVTTLVALPADGGNIEWQKLPPSAPAAATASTSASKAPAAVRPASAATTAADAAPKAGPGPMMVKRDPGKIALQSPERTAPPPPPKPSLWSRIWPWLVFFLGVVVGVGGYWVWLRVQRALGWVRFDRKLLPVANPEPEADVAPMPAAASGEPDAFPASDPRAGYAGRAPTLADWELTPDLMHRLEWKRFELLVQRYYGASGYRTKGSGTGADDAVDFFLFRAGAQRPIGYVQCRSGPHQAVELSTVRELFDLIASYRLPEGVIITTGAGDAEAVTFARKNRITLIAGEEFLARFNRLPQMVRSRIITEVTTGDYTTPTCPRCNVKLVRRTSETDHSAVWGCRRFPTCRYTTPAPAAATAGVA